MKRLVVCCDGTWNRPESEFVTNIEKIARSIEVEREKSGGVSQPVHYVRGVGGLGYLTDRLIGGAFGAGLFANVLDAYRFLALNYVPEDEIFVFGFSRGAYTARSLVGMIDAIGLLTRDALIDGQLPEAERRYRGKPRRHQEFGSSNAEFKADNCHTPEITMLGVLDTVGALGVPGWFGRRYRFLDVRLGASVRCARQALAIDERRLKYEPSLWCQDDARTVDPERVKQVWFEGAHSDVGGGYGDTGLSDTTLLWMAREATARGLVFDQARLYRYLGSGSSAIRHDSMTPFFAVVNLFSRIRVALSGNSSFRRGRRVLDPPGAINVRVASPPLRHVAQSSGDYAPPNLADFVHAHEQQIGGLTEQVEAMPASQGTAISLD